MTLGWLRSPFTFTFDSCGKALLAFWSFLPRLMYNHPKLLSPFEFSSCVPEAVAVLFKTLTLLWRY